MQDDEYISFLLA